MKTVDSNKSNRKSTHLYSVVSRGVGQRREAVPREDQPAVPVQPECLEQNARRRTRLSCNNREGRADYYEAAIY